MAMRARLAARERPRLDLVPMIDVAIFLLVFFMLFTTFKTDETGVPVELPQAATGTETPPANLTVSITRAGAIYLGDQLVTVDRVRQAAAELAARNPGATVIIRGDTQSYWEHAVSVMDAARQGGISSFAFGTQPVGASQ